MAQCKWCDKRGFFLSITPDGLCDKCNDWIHPLILSTTKIIIESENIMLSSKNANIRLERLDLVRKQLNELLKFEERGIPTITPEPSQLQQKYSNVEEQLVVEALEEKYYSDILEKFEKYKRIETKISLLKNALSDFLSFKKFIDKRKPTFKNLIERLRGNLTGCYNDIIIEIHVLQREGKKKKAIQKLKLAQTYLLDSDFNINGTDQLYKDIDEWIVNLSSKKLN